MAVGIIGSSMVGTDFLRKFCVLSPESRPLARTLVQEKSFALLASPTISVVASISAVGENLGSRKQLCADS